ncbi:hypothetical protein NL108_018501 [Boleophthalmus pectinirostris]|nr:hypothetical protein NL108_018501 [Boleophthalmus pectinirostris]
MRGTSQDHLCTEVSVSEIQNEIVQICLCTRSVHACIYDIRWFIGNISERSNHSNEHGDVCVRFMNGNDRTLMCPPEHRQNHVGSHFNTESVVLRFQMFREEEHKIMALTLQIMTESKQDF